MDFKSLFIEYYSGMYKGYDIDPSIWMSNYIADRMELNDEQLIWFCFLNSMTYHLPAAYLFINEFPDLENIDINRLTNWWETNQRRIPFQKDKNKPVMRKSVPATISSYQKLVKENGGSQFEFFNRMLNNDPASNFEYVYDHFSESIPHFGRFSTWNMAQMLKQVVGYPVSPPTLMLGHTRGWKSHTHGLMISAGRQDLVDSGGPYTKEEKDEIQHHVSLMESIINSNNVPTDPYMIETVACAYKKLFRNSNSRYLGYYLDRQAEDIRSIEQHGWVGVDWELLWEARAEVLGAADRQAFVKSDRFLEPVETKIVDKVVKSNTLF